MNPKAELLSWCLDRGIPFTAAWAHRAGGDPSAIRIGSLCVETRGCPWPDSFRRYLRKRCVIRSVECVYSTEQAMKPLPPDGSDALFARGRVRNRLPSLMTMPGMFGYALAQLVLDGVVKGTGGNVWESNPPRMV